MCRDVCPHTAELQKAVLHLSERTEDFTAILPPRWEWESRPLLPQIELSDFLLWGEVAGVGKSGEQRLSLTLESIMNYSTNVVGRGHTISFCSVPATRAGGHPARTRWLQQQRPASLGKGTQVWAGVNSGTVSVSVVKVS